MVIALRESQETQNLLPTLIRIVTIHGRYRPSEFDAFQRGERISLRILGPELKCLRRLLKEQLPGGRQDSKLVNYIQNDITTQSIASP